MPEEDPMTTTAPTDANTTDPEFSESGDISGDGGVVKEIIEHGEQGWHKPEAGDDIEMHYRGTLLDGTEFDSSYSRNTPFSFKLGEGKVIKGWDIVAKTMAKGEKAKVTLKPDYAYGDSGSPPKIPPFATLIFEMELLSWTSKRDVFGDGLVVKTEVSTGEGWERPGSLAEVTVSVVATAMKEDGRVEGAQLHSGQVTFPLGNGKVPPAWEKVIPDMRKDAVLDLLCQSPHTSGPGVDYVPDGTPYVRFRLTLRSWRKIEDILSDGTLVKMVLSEGEGWERPGDGAETVATFKFFKPDEQSDLIMPPAVGDALFVQEDVAVKVGDGVVIDGLDRALQSMKLKESALVAVAAKHAFQTAPDLLSSELAAKGVKKDSKLLVEVTLTKLEKAKDVWSMSFEEKVEEMRARKKRGNELFKDGRYETAKKSYDRAVNFFDSPTSELSAELKTQVNELLVQCHINLAMCLDRMGDVAKVLTHCKKALEIQPSNVKALYRQGCAFMELDDYYNAASSLKYAKELNPNNADVIRKLKELKQKRVKQDAEDKKLYSNLFGRMTKMEAKEAKTSNAPAKSDNDAMTAQGSANGNGEAHKEGVESKASEDVAMEDKEAKTEN